MKRLIRAAEEAKENSFTSVSRNRMKSTLKDVLHHLWTSGGSDSKKSKTTADFKNSDYKSFAKYIADHKIDIFDRSELIDPLYKAAGKFRDSEAAEQYMLKIYDNLTEKEFTEALGIK